MLSRLVLRMPALAGVILVSFALTRLLPGDPAVYFAGAAPTPEAIADLRRTLLLDQPLYAQFFAYLGDLAHGNFGRSLVTGQSVAQDLSTRLPATLELTIASTTLALLIAVPLGIVGARQKGRAMDHVCRLVSTSALAMPAFFTALLLVFLFYYLLGLAPAPLGRLAPMAFPPPERTGFMIIDASLARDWAVLRDAAAHLMLPALALAIAGIGPLTRVTRGAMLAVLSSDFIRAARGFDLPRWKLIYVYALRSRRGTARRLSARPVDNSDRGLPCSILLAGIGGPLTRGAGPSRNGRGALAASADVANSVRDRSGRTGHLHADHLCGAS